MSIVIVYLLYIWVALIHCVFVGATIYLFFGHFFIRQRRWVNVVVFLICLAFLEVYWIPIADILGLIIQTDDQELLDYFDIDPGENIVHLLRPKSMQWVIWMISGWIADSVGRFGYRKMLQNSK